MKIIISGGGTGGHIFPAIAIAQAIQKQVPEAEILFVGALGKMEMEKIPAAGYPIEGLWISGFSRRLNLDLLKFPFQLIASWWKSRQILKRFKPDAVVGVGGYASGVLVKVAASWGIPALIHEQNSYAGATNRLLSKSVQKICVAYPLMERFFAPEKIVFTGNPIRRDITEIADNQHTAKNYYQLNPDKKTLLVVGGSLGSRTINDSLAAELAALQQADIQVLWQCGKLYYDEFRPIAATYPNVKLLAFIDRMDLAYTAADLVVSRAGALALAELCTVKKPAILVPSPNVTDNHQTANAMVLVKKQAAVLIKDSDARQNLVKIALALIVDAPQLAQLAQNIASLAVADAASHIANELLKLIKK